MTASDGSERDDESQSPDAVVAKRPQGTVHGCEGAEVFRNPNRIAGGG